jgi:hypothetical protein
MVISIGLTYGNYKEVFDEVKGRMPLEVTRHEKLTQVSDKVGSADIYFVASDNNYGKDVAYSQLPLVAVTPELTTEINYILFRSKNRP